MGSKWNVWVEIEEVKNEGEDDEEYETYDEVVKANDGLLNTLEEAKDLVEQLTGERPD